MTTPDTIRPAIVAAMNEQGLTIAELARTAGLSRPTLSNYLRGEQAHLTTDSLERIMRVLRLAVRDAEDAAA